QCEAEARAAEERVRAEERCHWQEQLDDACRQADQKCQAGQAEADALRQEVEAVRQEREQAEKLRGQVAALEGALVEAVAARDGLARTGQEARAQYEAQARAAGERVRAEDRRHREEGPG